MGKLKIYSIIVGLLLVATGCTNNSSGPLAPANDKQSLGSQGDGNFGVVAFNTSVFKSFTFKNDSANSVILTPEIIGGNFDQVSLGCQNVAPGRSCLVKVLFNANKESGIYQSQLKVGSLTLPLSAEISSVPTVSYQFFIDGVETNGSLGVLSGNNLKLLTLKIKNNSPKVGISSSLISSSNKFNLIYSTCSSVSLKPNQSCFAKMVVKGDNSGNSLATNLSFDNQGPSLQLNQEVVTLSGNLQPLTGAITLGDVYKEGEDRIQLLTVENQGKGMGTISDVTVPPGFTVVSNNCLSIKPGNKCIIRVAYRTSDIPKGQYNNQIDLGDDASVQVTVNQVTNPNKLDKVILSVDSDVLVNSCSPVIISLKDVDNLDYVTSQAGRVTSNQSLYQDAECSVVDNSLAAFEPSKTFYIKKTTAGIINLEISYNAKSAQKSINWYNSLNAAVSPIIITNQSTNISVFGGKPPYQYSVLMGSGEVTSSGSYQSSTDGDMTIKIEDALHLTTTVFIKVVNPLQLVGQKNIQVVSSVQNFSATGGLAPVTYSVTGGSINPVSGIFTSPAIASSVVVKVMDASNQSSELTVTVVPVLTISPLSDKIITNQSKTFIGSGGVAPYTFSLTGVGSINSVTGVFSSGILTGSSVVKITDAIGQEAISTVLVVAPLTLTGQPNQVVNSQKTVTASGGLTPYNYTVVSGLGAINSTSGVFTAGATAGSVTLRVLDNSGQIAEFSVGIVSLLTISPNTTNLIISNNSSFTGSGGLPPLTYSVTGGGTINPANGIFTAPAVPGSSLIKVTDSLGQISTATATVVAPLTLTAPKKNQVVNTNQTVSASGGLTPYVYSVKTGLGVVNASSGVFTAPATGGSVILKVTDNSGQSAELSLNIISVLEISPVTAKIITLTTASFSGTGGLFPYSYSVTGGGTINPATGLFTAPAIAGSSMVTVTDGAGQTATSNITVVNPLTLIAAKLNQVVNTNQTVSASGGLTPYVYSVKTGLGNINSSTGVFTSGTNEGTIVLKVTDNSGQSAEVSINVISVLAISPVTVKVINSNTYSFSGSGGLLPYSFSVAGGGTISSSTGLFTAPVVAGSSVVTVTDGSGQTATSNITVVTPLTLIAAKLNQIISTTQTSTASGGLSPFVYLIKTGLGNINSSTGLFTASATAGTVVLKVTDNSGQSAEVSVNVVPVLTISPASASLMVAGTTNFSGVGGLAPYTYSILTGTGSVNSTSGSFIAPNTAGSTTVRVTDALNQTADAVVTVSANITISGGGCSYSVPESMPCTVTATGGIGTKTFSSNVGTINSSTGVFKGTCVNNLGSSIVTVTDQFGNSAQTTLTYPCVYASCNQIRAESYGTTNGDYWIDLDGLNIGSDPFQIYCDVTNSAGGGLSLISSGGSACGAANFTAKNSVSLNGSCGYLPESFVRTLSQNAQQVTLRSGASHSSYQEAKSSGTVTLNALRTGGNWNPGGSSGNFTEFTNTIGSWSWSYSCSNIFISSWPNMYQSCGNGGGVHWLTGTPGYVGQSNTSGSSITSSTWLLTKYNKYATSCQDAKNRGLKNQAGNIGSGIYTLDFDGYGQGSPSFNAYCDQSTDGGGWQMIASSWVTSYAASVNPAIYSLGQFIYDNGDTKIPAFKEMRHNCWRNDGGVINRKRTYSTTATTTNVNIFDGNAYSGTDTLLTGHNTSAGANWAQNGTYVELHYYYGTGIRFILRPNSVHCGLDYSTVGGDNSNERLGQEGMVLVR